MNPIRHDFIDQFSELKCLQGSSVPTGVAPRSASGSLSSASPKAIPSRDAQVGKARNPAISLNRTSYVGQRREVNKTSMTLSHAQNHVMRKEPKTQESGNSAQRSCLHEDKPCVTT